MTVEKTLKRMCDKLYRVPQHHPPQWSIPRSPTPPRRRPCVCAGACSLTTRWSTTCSTTGPCWRTHRQTVPACHQVPLGTCDCRDLIGLLLTCHHHEEDVLLPFSEQDKSEGDALHRERSGAKRSVWAVGDCHQHHRHQSSQWEGSLHDWYMLTHQGVFHSSVFRSFLRVDLWVLVKS